ncbi:MAG: HYR domain-containing protein [Crocinitomicaceae bacterium]|nr:HYR domain-containing protein [Crocinitomicaceae bacterium]
MKLYTIRVLTCAVLFSSAFLSVSQTEVLSLVKSGNVVEKVDVKKGVPSLTVPAPDVQALMTEDISRDHNGELFRIAEAVTSIADINAMATWKTLSDGTKVLRMKVKSSGAEALAISFTNFHLPQGATFRAFNTEQWHFSKSYSSQDNREDNSFMLPMVYGDEIVLEFTEPANAIQSVQATIDQVFYVYRESGNPMIEKDFGDSDPCEVNVNCSPEGDNWLDESRGVARIFVVVGGSGGWCTGSLVNNTAQDCKPYFLTALHCGDGASAANFNQWVFYFNYEAPGCTNPATQGSLATSTITGCVKKSDSNDGGGTSGSDFLLLQLGSSANEATTVNTLKSYNARWNGWDANNITSSQGVSIHHPAGDIKKISTYSSNLITTQWGSATGSHWRVTWTATTNGHGVTEGGSSGSPIFRNNGRIMGTLTGGSSFCTTPNNPDQYGKMSYHWQSNGAPTTEQLKPFLDPGNTGALVIDGSDDPCSAPALPVADFVANQTSVLEGTIVQFTDLTSGVPDTWSWTITPGTNTVEWEYTNATTSASQNPEVLFTTPGFYTVSLTASNAFGSDTETKTDYIEVIEIVCSDPVTTNYSMSFETGEDLSQWVVYDSNGDSFPWGIYDLSGTGFGAQNGNNAALYQYNTDAVTGGNDWLISGCFDLLSGVDYTLSYWRITDATYPENLGVFIGQSQEPLGMTTNLQQLNAIQDNTWVEEVINFTVPASGTYYFGWHCSSDPDQFYVAIDAINISGSISVLTITNAPADVSVDCDASTDPTNTGQLTASTGCVGGETISYSDVISAGSCANAYTIERTWTVIDGCGGNETHVQTITVEDNTAPVVTCGVATDVINTAGGSVALPNYIPGATITDNCSTNGSLVITQSPSAGTILTAGSYTVTIESVDECGNVGSCTISVTVNNSEVITVTNAPANVTIECDESAAPGNTGQFTATTSCATGGLVIASNDLITAGACANSYTIERTWTATDNCGNTETLVQTITVADNTAPVVVCGQSTDQLNTSTGSAQVPNYLGGATISDNCSATGDMTITQSPTAGTALATGTHTITITAVDECGNSNSCSIVLTIINDNGITITNAPANTTIECDESTDPTNTGQLAATTSCAGTTVITYADATSGTCPVAITRTWTITDGCGNTETYQQVITVVDTTFPVGVAPATVTVACIEDVPAADPNALTGVSDNCTANPTVAHVGDVSSGTTCPEVITRTYSITDDCGNSTTVTQTITVNDNTDPVITCNQTTDELFTTSGVNCPDYTSTVTATDNCTNNLTITQTPPSGTPLSVGLNTVQVVVTDDCGNTAACQVEVTVQDNVGLENNGGLNGLMLYPNPVSDELNVVFNTVLEKVALRLYDASGKLVFELEDSNASELKLSTSSLATGIYQLTVSTPMGFVTYKISKM